MGAIAVVTGAGAGIGRATAMEFARQGWDLALASRDAQRLESLVAEIEALGRRALAVPTDVADAGAVDALADRAESALGPIDAWINVAMATVFAPVADLTPAELLRATEVTYLGQAYGMMAALRKMRPRRRGVIVNVGSALVYRSVPLQAAYCGAKAAIRGFTDSLRSELLHEALDIRLTMVHLPAVNTPQFDWALNKTGHKAMPVPPVYQPEVAARAIHFAATHARREIWVGLPTVKAIIGNRLAPGLADRYLAHAGYEGQLSDEPQAADAPSNLFDPVPGHATAHGRFDAQARTWSPQMVTDRHKNLAWATALGAVALGLGALLSGRRGRHAPWRQLVGR